MANVVSRVGFSYRDVKGFSQTVRVFVSFDNTADGIALMNSLVAPISGLSNAAFNGGQGIGLAIPSSFLYGANAIFSTIEDKAIFTFGDTSGALHRWQIPAPKDAIFLADGETVDPANGLVVSFVTAFTTAGAGPSFVSSRAGQQITHFAGGIRIRRRIRRRINIFTLDPTLTGPDE